MTNTTLELSPPPPLPSFPPPGTSPPVAAVASELIVVEQASVEQLILMVGVICGGALLSLMTACIVLFVLSRRLERLTSHLRNETEDSPKKKLLERETSKERNGARQLQEDPDTSCADDDPDGEPD